MTVLEYFKKAQKEKWAIGQFNFSTNEQLKGIMAAAQNLKSPIIIGTSEGESKFLGLKQAVALIKSFKEETGFPVFLNLDHGKNLDYIKEAINFGYDCVHFDGSELSLPDNIKLTKEIVKAALKKDVLIEGEIGIIGKSTQIKEENLTRLEDVKHFVEETGVNSLAISIGNVHGVYQKMPKIDFERLKKIRARIETPLVLHGGSGVSEKDIKKLIKEGIVKININTELRVAWKKALKAAIKQSGREEIKPYKILLPASRAIQKVVEEKIKLFGSQNKA